jgi:hypothetical protein
LGDGLPEKIEDVFPWEEGFMTLAVERGQELLAPAGLPEAIARAPNPTADVARRLLRFVAETPLITGHETDYLQRVRALLIGVFDEIEGAVGSSVAAELRDWLLRHFVNHEERMRWWMWSVLLPRLASAYGSGPAEGSPLPAEPTDRFNFVVRARFNADAKQADEELERRSRMKALSSLERELVTLKSGSGEAVEVDVVASLKEAIRSERARLVWTELGKSFTPRERTLLVAWARAEGARRNMPVAFIATRSMED